MKRITGHVKCYLPIFESKKLAAWRESMFYHIEDVQRQIIICASAQYVVYMDLPQKTLLLCYLTDLYTDTSFFASRGPKKLLLLRQASNSLACPNKNMSPWNTMKM